MIYVDIDATGANDGTSWLDAYVDLQDALSRAGAGDEIWVAEGVYSPSKTQDYRDTFALPSGVRVYGGFSGIETEADERDPDLHETTLTGDVGLPPGYQQVSEHIVTALNCDSSTLLEGFTVTGGSHGVKVSGGSPRFENVVFSDNLLRNESAGGAGGAGAFVNGGATPTFYRVDFIGNGGYAFGGGVYVASDGSWPRFEQVTFESNRSGRSGGGMYGSGEFANVEFRSNFCDDIGAGLCGGGTLESVVFIGNANGSGGSGAGMFGSGTLHDVQFIDNQAGRAVGGGLAGGGILENVLFERNGAPYGGGGLATGPETILVNCSFVNNGAGLAGHAVLVGQPPSPLSGWGSGAVPSGRRLTLINVTISSRIWIEADPDRPWRGSVIAGGRDDVELINCIVTADDIAAGARVPIDMNVGIAFVANSVVRGSGGSGPSWNPNYGTDLGGNLDADPLFVDPAAGDYRLRAGSPAIDAGDTDALPPDLLTDLDGTPRVIGASVDMGAYEASVPGLYGLFAAKVTPRVLQPASSGPEVLVTVEPLWEFEAGDIDAGTLLLNDALVPAAVKVGPQKLRLQFDRSELVASLGAGTNLQLRLSGQLPGGTPFAAVDAVTVLGSDTGRGEELQADGVAEATQDARIQPRFHLGASPNPFNPSTTIRYGVAESGPVELAIYDLAGRRVNTLVSGHVAAGEHECVWHGRDADGVPVASGIYLVRVVTPLFRDTLRLVLLK